MTHPSLTLKRLTLGHLMLLLTALIMALTMSSESLGLEQPEYEVLHKDGKIEYRFYQPYVVAETEVGDRQSYSRASNEGFMRLFRYISGNNTEQAEIAMTAPVQIASRGVEIAMTAPVQRSRMEQGWRVAFMLPGQYSLETAPVPTDERIKLRVIPGRLLAVIRYSGRWTERNLSKYETRLRESIVAAGVEILGQAESAAYNAPYTPPFMRRNEILIEVAGIPTEVKLTGES